MELVVGPAGAGDLRDWLAMRCALWPDAGADAHEAELRSFAGDDRFAAFLARSGHHPLGFAEVFVRPYANGCVSRPVPFLEGIWVVPGARRRGVGRALLAAVEAWARRRGFTEIGSDADVANSISHRAHAAWGFAETERVVYFRKALGGTGAT